MALFSFFFLTFPYHLPPLFILSQSHIFNAPSLHITSSFFLRLLYISLLLSFFLRLLFISLLLSFFLRLLFISLLLSFFLRLLCSPLDWVLQRQFRTVEMLKTDFGSINTSHPSTFQHNIVSPANLISSYHISSYLILSYFLGLTMLLVTMTLQRN